jgi:uncharacterized membrane protein
MLTYFLIKYLHLLGAMAILGTGAGIAFFMLMAHWSGDAAFIAKTARIVVIADLVFTATAVVAQPATGYLLMRERAEDFSTPWIAASLALYVVAGLFWLPVIWMQVRMRDLAAQAAAMGQAPSDVYRRLFRWWFAFGFPGFGAVLAITWLMIAKPSL